MRKVVIPLLEHHSGKQAGVDFGICNNPEFLREGSAVADFKSPPKTVIGELEQESGKILASLYQALDAPLIRTDLETAEMIKYVDNCWHALKIGFANEIGNLCDSFGVDAKELMGISARIRSSTFRPRILSLDLLSAVRVFPRTCALFRYQAKMHDLQVPILNSVLPSNEIQIARGVRLVMESGNSRIGVLGFSFKAGTDDLRREPCHRSYRAAHREGL